MNRMNCFGHENFEMAAAKTNCFQTSEQQHLLHNITIPSAALLAREKGASELVLVTPHVQIVQLDATESQRISNEAKRNLPGR